MSQALLFTIATMLLDAGCEALFFNDGHLEIGLEADLDCEQVKKLRLFLNIPEIVAILEQ